MSETEDELEELRAKRREELTQELDEDESGEGTPDEPVHVEDAAHFDRLVADNDVVLVDFYADWCGPCKMLEPVVKELAAETDALVAKVDIDALQNLAAQHQVRGVPTLEVYADGQKVDQMVGVQQKEQLQAALQSHL